MFQPVLNFILAIDTGHTADIQMDFPTHRTHLSLCLRANYSAQICGFYVV